MSYKMRQFSEKVLWPIPRHWQRHFNSKTSSQRGFAIRTHGL